MPISLSYHAGGLKVGEPSSWVGTGWSLQAGGMISRTIQGKADESCGGFFTTGSEIAVSGGCITTTANVSNSELADATKDGEPDIFSFSVGGYSGKFYIEKQTGPVGNKVKGKVVLIPQQDVKIDYIVTSVEGSDCSNRFRLQRFMLTTPRWRKI